MAESAPVLTADTNTRCFPWVACLPLLPVPLCCTNCDGANGAGQGMGAFVQFAFCCCMHSGEWTGLYDLTKTVHFELTAARGLMVRTNGDAAPRVFSMEKVEEVGLYSSVCELRLVPTSLSGEGGESVPCSSGAVLVEVYKRPSRLVSSDELTNPSLPSLVDALCDPLTNARARLNCLANFALCGCVVDSGTKAAPPFKRVRCVFLGARVKGKGIVRLSQRAWRAASVAKLAAVAAQVHQAFPPLAVGPEGTLVVESVGEVALGAPARARGKAKAPTPLEMDAQDRMAYVPPGVIRSAEHKGSVAGVAG